MEVADGRGIVDSKGGERIANAQNTVEAEGDAAQPRSPREQPQVFGNAALGAKLDASQQACGPKGSHRMDGSCGITMAVIDVLSSVVTAESDELKTHVGPPELTPGTQSVLHHRAVSCRFLISLITIDAFSWGIGKMFEYEVVLLVEELDECYLAAALVLATAEIFIEFMASAVTPFLYRLVQRHETLTSTRLVHFALQVYWMSNVVALFIYPCFFVLIHVMDTKTWGVVIALGITRSIQYAFGNQVGDAAVEMARPHWLASFAGLRLCFPGCRCRCIPRLARSSNSHSLALYLTLARFIVFSILAMGYVMIRRNATHRWFFAFILLAWNVLAPSLLLYRFPYFAEGLVDEVATESQDDEAQRSRMLALSQLRGAEIAFLAFIVLMKGVPPQSTQALQSVLVLELPKSSQMLMVALFFCSITFGLATKIYRRPDQVADHGDDAYQECDTKSPGTDASPQVETSASHSYGSFLISWMVPAVAITGLLMAGSASVFFIAGTLGLYIAMAIWVPLGALQKFLESSVDTFLLRYDAARSSDLIYWQNVFQVLVNFPMLVVNGIVIELSGCHDEEGTELRIAGALLGVAVVALTIGCGYFTLIDPRLPRRASLASCVDVILSAQEGADRSH